MTRPSSYTYKVERHTYLNGSFAVVTLHCIGYATAEVQPVEWSFDIRVPVKELGDWPLGAFVRMALTL